MAGRKKNTILILLYFNNFSGKNKILKVKGCRKKKRECKNT